MWVTEGATGRSLYPWLTSLVPMATGTCSPKWGRREEQQTALPTLRRWGKLLPHNPKEKRHRTSPLALTTPCPGSGWGLHDQ